MVGIVILMVGKEKKDKENKAIDAKGDAKNTLKNLENALKLCEKERDEYLDGWKRSKADAVNEKKRQQKLLAHEQLAALGRYALAILPVLDSARAARAHSLETSTESGIEQIHAQCVQSFTALGIEIVDPLGMPFDPHKHQAVSEKTVHNKKEHDTVIEVIRVGAGVDTSVIRAALVCVGKYEEKVDE